MGDGQHVTQSVGDFDTSAFFGLPLGASMTEEWSVCSRRSLPNCSLIRLITGLLIFLKPSSPPARLVTLACHRAAVPLAQRGQRVVRPIILRSPHATVSVFLYCTIVLHCLAGLFS